MQSIEKKLTQARYRLTKLGEQMACLPIDPKIARILLAAKKHDCMAEILVIASALSIQDPRERTLRTRLRRRVYPTVFRRRFQQPHRIHDPEIVRSNLAAVILRMAALKLGDVAAFPFLEMPDSRYINDGFQVLLELGAVGAV